MPNAKAQTSGECQMPKLKYQVKLKGPMPNMPRSQTARRFLSPLFVIWALAFVIS